MSATTAFPTSRKQVTTFYRKYGMASSRMTPVRENWTRFATACTNLEKCCNLDICIPTFMAQYATLSNSFRHFNLFSVTILNSPHPDGDPRAQLEQSGIWQSSQELVRNWIQFIKNLNHVTVGGLSPFFPMLVKSIDDVYTGTNDVAKRFFVGSLKSKISPAAMNDLRGELANLRGLADAQIQNPGSGFDTRGYVELVAHATSVIEALFLGPMPRYTVGTSEIMLDKVGLKIAMHELSMLAAGMVAFEDAAADLRKCTSVLNADLSALLKTLGLPWDLRLQEKGAQEGGSELAIEEQDVHHAVALPASPRSAQAPKSPRNKTAPIAQTETSTTLIDST
jgi:hypothetical protein